MTTSPVDLTLEIRSEDGSSTEFFQSDEEYVARTLRLVSTPRLFVQPLLFLASQHGVSAIPSRMIDMILVRTLAPASFVLPVGLIDISEVRQVVMEDEASPPEETSDEEASKPVAITTSFVEIHTVGGWSITLRIKAVTQTTVHDQRQSLAHFFDLPVVPFRLEAGGVGFVNPTKISRITSWPTYNGVPDTALMADLLRWTTVSQRKFPS
ncbi:MAG TPA: hypothetical protein P5186_28370 [Candidatus Paceibacterota bacterium]|nr:hypothetical protein [Verrucomicrobiota bacterium]HRY51964.1 hypothetical protein [Candidatus Paceibacterota bacterium]HSA00203.1 hypothetical protein [Candidatus Paceibacterota bacterium]